jgi:hypothetical protein
MKVAFFHGLESNEKSEKSQYLKTNFNSWCPAMDYRNPKLFDEVLAHIQKDKPDLLIGSSMGGWFAYCLSTLTGIPTLLLNPAVQGRTMEPKVHLGNMKANHSVVLGSEDIVIDPVKTKTWFKGNCKGNYEFHMERIGHRTPNAIMVKHLKVNESLKEEWATESPSDGTNISILPESVIDILSPNFLVSRPPVSGGWTVEDQKEIADVLRIQKGLSDDDIKFAQRVAKSPVDEFYTYLTLRGQRINRSEIDNIWNDKSSIDLIGKIKDAYKRSRPYWAYPEVNYIPNTGSSDYSFPSGHACGSWRIALRLSKRFPHLRDGLENIAKRISDSRVYSGVHYPSDIKFGKDVALILEKN